MTKFLMRCILLLASAPAFAGGTYWVTVERADRRTCPAQQCGVVGFFLYRDKVDVIDVKAGWAHVGKGSDAQCSDGRSAIVESGNDECTAKNGIVNGRFSEWVQVQQLSKSKPADGAPK